MENMHTDFRVQKVKGHLGQNSFKFSNHGGKQCRNLFKFNVCSNIPSDSGTILFLRGQIFQAPTTKSLGCRRLNRLPGLNTRRSEISTEFRENSFSQSIDLRRFSRFTSVPGPLGVLW